MQHGAAVGHDRQVGALALHVGLAERNQILAVRDLAALAVEQGVLQKHHRIVVANGGLEQALGVVGGGRDDDLHAGMMREDVFGRERVGGADIGPAVRRAADHDRAVDQAARHVAEVGRVVEDLVEGDGVERPEHQFHDRAQAEHGCAHAEADEPGFADRSVDDAARTEPGEETLGDLVRPVELADLLAEHDDIRVAVQFLGERVAHRFAIRDDRHGKGGGFAADRLSRRRAGPRTCARPDGPLPVDVFLDVVDGGEGARLSEIGGGIRFRPGLLVDPGDRLVVQHALGDQLVLEHLDRILRAAVLLDLGFLLR